jgi:hypothetical protein
MYAQAGDLLLKAAPIPDTAIPMNGLTLLGGSSGSNAHRFAPGSHAKLLKDGGTIYAFVEADSQLIHEEHKPITIPAGTYIMDIVREHDYETDEMKRVVD